MPPFLPRKHLRSPSPAAGPSGASKLVAKKGKSESKSKSSASIPRKATLFDDLDAGTRGRRSADRNKAVLKKLAASDDETDSSLSSLSDDEFEDVPSAKRQKTAAAESEDEDEDIEFEDVETHAPIITSAAPALEPSGDLELTLTKETRVSITNPHGTKKGPSKIERGIRTATHQMHVMCLMWHNALRNSWCCDKEVQDNLIKQLPPRVVGKVEQWRKDMGIEVKEEKMKGKGKGKNGKEKDPPTRNNRDWGSKSERINNGEDPTQEVVRALAKYWKINFRITKPGLRKLGYMSLQRLDEEMKSYNKEPHDPERHGECIRDVKEFRERAKLMEGSRDVGAQLFTALLRGLGVEARMVASLQPVGFGWSQVEEAFEKNPRALKKRKNTDVGDRSSSSNEELASASHPKPKPKPKLESKLVKELKKGMIPMPKLDRNKKTSTKAPSKRTSRGSGLKDAPVEVSEAEVESAESSDASVIDMTPQRKKASLPYDKDLQFPHYWTEVFSPVTNTYIPVETILWELVATRPEFIDQFEIRGAKSEKAKQVTAYIIGHSSDGTAKDVTTRYLKRHVWPGRTKGNRFPKEKIAVHNRHGKVKRYEERDWFKGVMSGYVRGTKKCPRTEIDDLEDATDLKPVKAEKKEVEEGKETLQSYKSSAEFVLERHLRREEALVLVAKHVKMFSVGKGDKTEEEKVFLRKDVVNCKSMETWHKEGRAPKVGEVPLKRVPYRAATTNRKRELAEAEHASGEKMLQGLYSWDQTDWIIPPPIENGVIPKNAFGNIDLYVESMLPQGAIHIPMRGTVKICKRLNIDYAEAVTGFEFGHRMAVPVITGVVVAEEHYEAVMDEWQKDEAERERKEDEKRRKAALTMWRKMLMGLRIVERFKGEYGEVGGEEDVLNPWINRKKNKDDDEDLEEKSKEMNERDEEMAGGFLPEGFNAEEPEAHHESSFFPVHHNDEEDDHAGGFVVEDHVTEAAKPVNGHTDKHLHFEFAKPTNGYVSDQGDDEDEDEVEDRSPSPPPRTRARPASSANNPKKATASTPASAKRKTPAKASSAQRKTPASTSTRRRKPQVQISEEKDDDEDESSSLSELNSDSASEDEEEVVQKKSAKKAPVTRGGRKAAVPSKVEGSRKTPRRSAATGVRSQYFEHDEDEDDDE